MRNVTTEETGAKQQAQLRKHYYLDQYAVIAPGRNKRPHQFEGHSFGSKRTEEKHPIEDNPSVYEVSKEGDGWDVKVVENIFPAFTEDNPNALGKQEVILETDQPNTGFQDLDVERIRTILDVYQHRATQLGKRYNYVSIFKNHGYYSGASLQHSHSQIIATDIVPQEILNERKIMTNYQSLNGSSPLCDVIRWELNNRVRVVAHTRYMTTICPYASRFPLEAWIIPNRQAHSISDLVAEEVYSMADHLKGVTTALANKQIDFNYHVQEPAPDSYNHTFIKVVPRLNIIGGFEHNTAIHVNTVSPEYAARWYQKHIKTPDAV